MSDTKNTGKPIGHAKPSSHIEGSVQKITTRLKPNTSNPSKKSSDK